MTQPKGGPATDAMNQILNYFSVIQNVKHKKEDVITDEGQTIAEYTQDQKDAIDQASLKNIAALGGVALQLSQLCANDPQAVLGEL